LAVTINIGTGQGNREDWFNLPVEEQWRRAGYKVVWKPGVEGSALRAKGWTPPEEVPAEAWQRQIAGMEAWRRAAEAPKVERGVERAEEEFERKRRRPYFPMPLKEWPKPEVVTPPPPVAVKAAPPRIEVPPPTVEKPEGTREAVETIKQQLAERPFLPPTTVEAIGKPAPEVVTAPLAGALEAWRAWKRQPIAGIIPRTAEEAVKGAVKALQQPAYWLERGIGTYALEAMKRRPKAAYERVVPEHPMTHLEAAALLGGVEIKPEQVEAWRRADEKLRELNLPPKETAELARTYYTWGAHPERLEKALDEIKQGASIDEVVRKYEDPIVEAIGQIVLDPLDIAGSWLGKLRDVRLLNRVRNQFVRKAEPIVQETVEQMPWFKRAWQQIGGKIEQLNPFRITAHSKARALDRHLNSFTGLVLRRAKTPDEAKILLKSFVEAPESLPPEFGSFVKSPAANEVRKALKMMDIDSFRTLKPDREFKLMDFLSELYDKSIKVTNELYGVKPPSTAEKYAQGFKSFMADFYMGISPRALIRNAAGNVSFLTYDGLLSFASHNHIDDYMIRSFGFSPAQFQRGLGLTREYRGPKRGLPIIRELADLGRRLYSGNIPLLGEAWARYGASYRACQKFDDLYWRPGGLIDLSAFDDLWPYIDPNTKANLIAAWRQSLNGEELIENTEKALSGLTLVARYIDDAEEVSPGFVKAIQEVVDEAGDDAEKLAKGVDEVAAEIEKRLARAEQLENLPVTVKPKEAALLPGIEAAEEFRKGKPEEIVKRTYATMVREMTERGATAEGLWMSADEMAKAAYELDMWKKGEYARRAWAKHVSPDIPFPTKLTELRRFIEEQPELAKKWQDYLWAKMAEANTPTYQLLSGHPALEGVVEKAPKAIKEVETAAEKAADLQAELYQTEQYLESLQDYLKAQPLDQKTVFKLWDYHTGTFKRVRDRATGKLVSWEYAVTDDMATELGFRSQEDLLQAVRDYVDAHKKVKELKGRIKALKAELASLPKEAVEEGEKIIPKAEEVAEAVEAARVEEAAVEAVPEVAKVAEKPTTMAERVAKMTKNEARKRLETIENFLDEQKRLGRAIAPKLEKDLRAEANALRAKLGMKKAMEVVHADEVAEYKRLIRQLRDYIDRGYPESETGRIRARLDEIAERARAEGWWDELREFARPSGWEIVGEPKLVEEAAAPPKVTKPKRWEGDLNRYKSRKKLLAGLTRVNASPIRRAAVQAELDDIEKLAKAQGWWDELKPIAEAPLEEFDEVLKAEAEAAKAIEKAPKPKAPKVAKPKAPPKILPGGVQPADWVHTPKGDGIAARTARVRSGAVLTWVYDPEKGRAFSVPVTDISKAEPPDEYVKWLGDFAEWARKQAKRFKGSTAKDYERIATRALSRAAAMTSGMPSYAKGVRSASEAELKLIERLKKGITRDKAEPVVEELKRVFLDRVKQVLVPAREDANMAKLQWAYEVVNRALYDYDKRYELDRLIALFFPFHFWPTRTGYQAAMRMITKPWTVTSYYRMRKAIERINEEMGFPRRYGPTALFVPAPEGVAEALPEWAEKRVPIDIMPFIFPHVGVWPFNYLAKVDWDDNNEAKTALDRLADLQHIFGMAPHWPLQVALDMARGKRENIWYILPQTGVLKGMTAYMREKWPERFGWIPPGGLNIEKPFRVGLGLPEAAGYEAEYWPESMVLDMAANEEITPEERDAVLNPASPMYHQGPIWEEAVNRAAILKQLPTAVSYFLGIRPRLLPKGEMRIRRAEGLAEIYERERAGEKGPEIREARRKWYEANPWYTSRGLLWTPGPERVVQFREREYYDKRRAIYDRYAKDLDKVPLGDWRARQTIYRKRQEELDALDDEYKDIVRTPSFWGWTPSEIETYYEDKALRPVAEAYYAIQPEQFKDKEGKIDWDAFYRARDEFLNNPKKWLPYLDKSALREMGIKGKIPQLSWLTRARLERYLRRNDDPKEALWRVYKETVINPAQKAMFAEAEGLSGAERAELFDKYYSNYPARPATEFITRVLAMYPEKGWTYDQLAEIYRDITLPGLKEVRRRGMSPRDRAISDLWEFYMALPALDKRRLKKALGDRFQRLFVNKKTRDYDAITDEELIYWLNYAGLDPGLLPEMAEARGAAVKAAEAEFLKEWGAYEPKPWPGAALTEAGLQAPSGRFQRVSPELAAEYDQALRERAEMWEAVRSIVPNYSELMDAYSKLKWWEFNKRKALREQLEPAWRFMDEWKASHPVMVKWLYPTWQPYTPKPKRRRGRRRRKTKRETLEDMATDWWKFAEGMEDKGLLELIQSYLLLPEAQRGWFLRRYPDLAAWLQDKSPEWLAALAQSLAAHLALTEPKRRRVRRAPKLRWYRRW